MKIWLPKINYYSKRLSTWHEKLWQELTGKPYMGILDNVAGVRFYKEAYGTVGAKQRFFTINPGHDSLCNPQGATKQNAVSSFPYGTISAAGIVDQGLTTQIDRGTGVYDTYDVGTSTTVDCDAWGYAVTGETYHTGINFGSMDSDTYNDGGGTSRTIKGCYATDTDAACVNDDEWIFSLDGTSISNSDTTWQDIDWDDVSGTPQTIDRSVNTTYTASLNGSSHWRWISPTPSWRDTDANTDFVLTVA